MEEEKGNSVNVLFLESFERDVKLAKWSSSRTESPTIYRVSHSIRNVDSKAYDPKIISIGPYHRGNQALAAMEKVKLSYLNQFLSRNTEMNLEKYLKEMKDMEDHVRHAYWGKVDLKSEEFVRMMLVDGCFIVEFLLQWFLDHKRDHKAAGSQWEDPIRGVKMTRREIIADMLLLENQLPFSLLKKLLRFVSPKGNLWSLMTLPLFIYYADLILHPENQKFEDMSYIIKILNSSSSHHKSKTIHHFLHLCHQWIVDKPKNSDEKIDHSSVTVDEPKNSEKNSTDHSSIITNQLFSILSGDGATPTDKNEHEELRKVLDLVDERVKSSLDHHNRIPSATELNDAGVRFRKKKNAKSLLDVSFDRRGYMEIPQLHIYDKTNSIFHNLIAFEQCYREVGFNLSAYCLFLDVLVNTPADVAILQKKGIIMSHLGSDKDVSRLTNQMCREVFVNIQTSYLKEIFKDVNNYSTEIIHEWRAKLKTTYFGNPWAIISFCAGIFLMMFSIMSITMNAIRFFRTY